MTVTPDRTIAVLGTGAVGTAVTSALLGARLPVVAWNRTAARTAAVGAAGAVVVDAAADAVSRAALTLVCLTDHDGVRDLLRGLPPAASHRALAVLSTGTPEDATRAATLAHERGFDYLDVGLQTAPDDIGTPAASLLYAGSPDVVDTHRSALEALGPVTWVGEDPAAAAVWDLALFGLWYDAQLGLLRALEHVTAAGVPAPAFADAARRQLSHVVDAVEATTDEVAERTYPRGPASLAEHAPVLAQLRAARAGGRLGDGGLAPVADLVDRLIAEGEADAGLTALLEE